MTTWDDSYKKGEGLRWWPEQELIRFLGRVYGATWSLVKVAHGKALDLGCGTGRNMWALHEAGFEPYGCEASLDALVLAGPYLEQRQVTTAMLISAELPQILYADGLFDLVIDCQTIQHLSVEEHAAVYGEVARVLKPGGRFWSMHVGKGNFEEVYGGRYPELREWGPDELEPLMHDAGFVFEKVPTVVARHEGGVIAWHVIECQTKQ
jgi:ubiquinone/menaquinone biosynthesis C-methylase UbiE